VDGVRGREWRDKKEGKEGWGKSVGGEGTL